MRKCFIIFSLVLLLLFSFTVNCFAANDTYVLQNGDELSIPPIPENLVPYTYVLYYQPELNWVHFYFSVVEGSRFVLVNQTNGYYMLECLDANGNKLEIHKMGTGNGYAQWTDWFYNSDNAGLKVDCFNNGLVTANRDIRSSDGSIFFQVTPVTGTLAPILEKVEMKETITTTIVGLAVLLIPLLICLIGFWKAWKLLSKILHKS